MSLFTSPPDILLDRDGVLIEERHYLSDPDQVRLTPGAAAGLRRLAAHGTRFFLVTNQSGIGRGYFTREAFRLVQDRIYSLLNAQGVTLAGTAFCPHAPDEECACRKPRLGMWEKLRMDHGLRPENTIIIGDKMDDIAFGRGLGAAASLLVRTGHGGGSALEADKAPPKERPDAVLADLAAACDWILERMG